MPSSYHMTPDEFRRWGRETVEWIAGYMERVEELPVLSRGAPGDVRGAPPPHPPAPPPPARGGAVRRHPGRPRPRHPAGHHALAVAALLRLLPEQRVRPLD